MQDETIGIVPEGPQFVRKFSEIPARPGTGGMTLRDWFAGQALAGLLADLSIDEGTARQQCVAAYRFADEMLTAREAS